MRVSLAVLAVGPLVVSTIFALQRARSDAGRLAGARDQSAAAMASFSLGRMEADLDLERTFMVGTIRAVEANISLGPLAVVIGGDPRDIVAQLATTVDTAEPTTLARLRTASDADAADELARLLVPRRSMLADAEAGRGSAAAAAAHYDELEAFLDELREDLGADSALAAHAAGVDDELIGVLETSAALDTWSGAVAEQAEQLTALMDVSNGLQPHARSRAGAAVMAGDEAIRSLQQTPYLAGTPLAEGSPTVERWIQSRDALLAAVGMGNEPAVITDQVQQLLLVTDFARASGELLNAAIPVYEAVDRDIVAGVDGFVGDRHRTLLVGVGVELLVVGLAVAWVVVLGRRIVRPLVVVGRRAREVSNGKLTDDRVGPIGPREVAQLANAFDEVCDNLRLVEHKTEALAAGRMDDPVLAQRVPGALGLSLQRSIDRVSELTERLADQARRDPMTGLPNRAAALEHLGDALHRWERSDGLLAVLFIDLDGFKAVNDAYGHPAGDEVLRQMAGRFREIGRGGELVARLGGDEFVVVAEGAGDPTGAMLLGRRLVEAAERPVVSGDATFSLSASVGVALAHADSTAMSLLGDADHAVYQAKRDGRARVQLFDGELQAAMVNRAALERDLRRALVADEFDIHVQPVVDAATGALHGLEALVRWNRPGHGTVSPGEFIPVAEESWLIVEIGRVVLDKACRALAARTAAGHRHTMSVNIAGRHLVEADLVGDVRDALQRHGAAAELLVVELTESQLVTDLERAALVLTELRALGVRVALDDFGTGYSSLNYLRQLPIDALKIDRSYISGLTESAGSHALVASLIQLAGSLDLDVVAEGVETAEQAERLRAIGCPKLQGFLIARPMPVSHLPACLPAALG